MTIECQFKIPTTIEGTNYTIIIDQYVTPKKTWLLADNGAVTSFTPRFRGSGGSRLQRSSMSDDGRDRSNLV